MQSIQATLLRVRPARLEDLGELDSILEQARGWLARAGIAQWQAPFSRQDLKDAIREGRVVMAYDEASRLVGSLHLTFGEDPAWAHQVGTGAFIHRLVVSRSAIGRGVGNELLNWAQKEADKKGFTTIRLYCVDANTRLKEHYFSMGFIEAGKSVVPRAIDGIDVPVALLERQN